MLLRHDYIIEAIEVKKSYFLRNFCYEVFQSNIPVWLKQNIILNNNIILF